MLNKILIYPLCGYPYYNNCPSNVPDTSSGSAEDAAIRAERAADRAEAAADMILNMDINLVGDYQDNTECLTLTIEKEF